MTVIKVRMLTSCDIHGDALIDFYIQADKISGWYVPNDNPDFGPMLNILLDSEFFGIKQEPHILKYLDEHFVKPSKKW